MIFVKKLKELIPFKILSPYTFLMLKIKLMTKTKPSPPKLVHTSRCSYKKSRTVVLEEHLPLL